jgi:penicillin-binding protein 1A
LALLRVRREKGTSRPRRRVRKRRLAALLLVLLVAAVLSFTFGLMRAVASEIPTLDPAAHHADVDTVVYASNGRTVLAVLRGDESRVLVGKNDIAPIMKQAIVSVEDQRFYEHNGVDVHGIARALWEDVRHKGIVEGGSTITQQFVKNAYIRNEKTFARKVREAALAWQLEQDWKKDRILTAYLNTIYFGHGAYGIQQAARAYFKTSAMNLTLAESALLAGIPSDPSLYDPAANPRSAKLRRRHVLELMLQQHKITWRQYKRADKAALPKPDDIRLPGTVGPAPYFVNYVKDDLVAHYGAGRVFGGGLKVTTTIDMKLQLKARAAIESVLQNPDGPAAALVAIDPRNGAVKAMFGGRNFRRSQFNLAAQAKRQPGSSFKPFVLATAMDEGISPLTELESKPVSIDAGDRVWRVTNYDHTYLGRVSLSRALVSSDNSVYAQLTDIVGPKAIAATAHRLGIQSHLTPYFSIGLGSGAVSPLEMARAYATIANDGRRVDGSVFANRPRVVEKVARFNSKRVDTNTPMPRQIMDEGQAELLTSILEDVVRVGTGKRAAIPGREIAGKTGTTDNYGDAWFVGYTPSLVVAVWVGYPDALKPMLTEFDGEPVAGGTLPALIWKAFMEKTTEDPARSFDSPPYLGGSSTWVVRRSGRWQLDNGYCRGSRLVAYFSGDAPDKEADCKPNEVAVPLVVGMTKAGAEATLAAQPLDANIAYAPAKSGRLPGLVVSQDPRSGGLSAHDSVTIWVSKAEFGMLPNFVGSSIVDVQREAARLKVRLHAKTAPGRAGAVLRQRPEPGVAIGRRMRVTIVVGDGSQK